MVTELLTYHSKFLINYFANSLCQKGEKITVVKNSNNK